MALLPLLVAIGLAVGPGRCQNTCSIFFCVGTEIGHPISQAWVGVGGGEGLLLSSSLPQLLPPPPPPPPSVGLTILRFYEKQCTPKWWNRVTDKRRGAAPLFLSPPLYHIMKEQFHWNRLSHTKDSNLRPNKIKRRCVCVILTHATCKVPLLIYRWIVLVSTCQVEACSNRVIHTTVPPYNRTRASSLCLYKKN